MSEDEFDNLPDLFTGLSEAEWSRILDNPLHHPQDASLAGRSTSSTDYEDSGFMDSEALAQLDRIEAQVMQTSRAGSASLTHRAAPQNLLSSRHNPSTSAGLEVPILQSHYFVANASTIGAPSRAINAAVPEPPQSDRRRQNPCSPVMNLQGASDSSQRNYQGKTRADETVQWLIDGYEEEMTCPICCDLFVATHVGNPCGHSYCGDCGFQWFEKNKPERCPICRTRLCEKIPFIPNLAMDNLVEKHIGQLGLTGDEDWQPHGSKFKEWASRNEKWKSTSSARLKVKRSRKAQKRPAPIDDYSRSGANDIIFLPTRDDDDDDSYVDESSYERAPPERAGHYPGRPRRRGRRR